MKKIQEDFCPTCGSQLDAATGLNDPEQLPSKGDVSLCAYCGELLEYSDNLVLIKMRPGSLDELNEHDRKVLMGMSERLKRKPHSKRLPHLKRA